MANNTELIKQCEERAQQWLTPSFDEETRKEVKAMLDAEDKSALVDAFYQNLEFGTGGLRGIMGAGTNRMNKYIVGMATQGFANYILKAFPGEENLSVQWHQGLSLREPPSYTRDFFRYPRARCQGWCQRNSFSQP